MGLVSDDNKKDTLVGVDVGAVSPHALFFKFAGLMLIEAIFSVAAVREEGTLNNNKQIKNTFNKYIFFYSLPL